MRHSPSLVPKAGNPRSDGTVSARHREYRRADRMLRHPPERLEEIAPPLEGEIPSTALTGYCDLVRTLGGNAATLLAEAGIAPLSAGDLPIAVPLSAVSGLLEASAVALGCPDFGMRLAERQEGTRIAEPLARLLQSAPSYCDALTSVVAHGQAYTSAIRASLTYWPEHGSYCHRCNFPSDGIPTHTQLVELILLLTQLTARQMSADRVHYQEVWFAHPSISPVATYRRRFRSSVRFGQEFNGLFMAEALFTTPLPESDEQTFRSELRAIAASFPAGSTDFMHEARQALDAAMREGAASRRVVAEKLDTSIRTLNRRLRDQGTGFTGLRDEVRRHLAIHYLVCTDMSFTDIAGRLGFAELAVFSRACRRWFALPPSHLRQRFVVGPAERD